jgi:signal transduction histidine kinase
VELILVSADPDLRLMCCEVLGQLAEDCNVTLADINGVPPAGDVYIWDFQPGYAIPDHIAGQPAWKHLFLVERKDLGLLRQHGWCPELAVLLKPITRVTLAAFLGQALAACAGELSPAATVRASSDELLQCLIQTNLRLQDYDQERTNFLARAAHDFRAPLTAINGYCGLLIAEPLGSLNEDQKEVLRRMQRSAKRLSRMTSAMFQLSVRGQVQPSHPNFEPGDRRDCIDQAIHEIAPSMENKRIEISVDLSSPRGPLLLDQSQMEEVLLNLLDNACKFTPKGGSIEIKGYSYFWDRRNLRARMARAMERRFRSSPAPNSFRLDIRDSGPGIPEEHLDSIFEQYTRYSETQDRTGGGLGLAICKMLMDRHYGRVWAESSESGATFSLVVPFFSAEAGEENERVQYAVA